MKKIEQIRIVERPLYIQDYDDSIVAKEVFVKDVTHYTGYYILEMGDAHTILSYYHGHKLGESIKEVLSVPETETVSCYDIVNFPSDRLQLKIPWKGVIKCDKIKQIDWFCVGEQFSDDFGFPVSHVIGLADTNGTSGSFGNIISFLCYSDTGTYGVRIDIYNPLGRLLLENLRQNWIVLDKYSVYGVDVSNGISIIKCKIESII